MAPQTRPPRPGTGLSIAVRPSDTFTLHLGGFLGPFGGAVLSVIIPELQSSFDASRATIATAIPAYLIPFAIVQLAAGPIANRLGALARPHPAAPRRAPDRLGRRRAAAAGCIWCAGSVAAAGLVGTGTGLALAWLAAGAGSVLRWNGLNTLAVEAAPANRATLTSVFSACRLAGNAAAPLAWLPIYDVRISAAFLVAGATCLAIVSLIRTYPAASGDGTLPTR